MSALAYIALGVLVALLLAVLGSKDAADETATFGSLANAHRYALQQDAAGYDCFVSPRGNGLWEVRCYRRQERAR
ncbi:hypothetical protein AB8810_10940 [Xanthomonas sp. NCPPB 3005]|uniref:hypothetical protein n=1 Tax=Xanthomonas sp. NCPPB 3005 TaxID=3240913 RepID=UPI003511B9CF